MNLRPLPLAAALWCAILAGGSAHAAGTVPVDTGPVDTVPVDTVPVQAVPVDTVAPIATNDFIPENANLGDCVSSLPRPGCGSEARSNTGQLLTFGVLLLATVFIGWRIVRSVRQRESAADQQVAAERDGPADERVG